MMHVTKKNIDTKREANIASISYIWKRQDIYKIQLGCCIQSSIVAAYSLL